MNRGFILIIGFGLVAFLVIFMLILPIIQVRPLGNPPVTAPPIGYDDIIYHDEHVSLEATPLLSSINNSIVFETFETGGNSVCFYGNYTSNRLTRFFITDHIGFREIQDYGYTDRGARNFDNIYGFDWNWILAPYQNGSFVEKWYVVISAFGYPLSDWDRDVNYFICQDKTAPYVDLEIPRKSFGEILLNLTIYDLHSNIVSLQVSINGTLIFNPPIYQMSYGNSIPINTSQYTDGYYVISIYVSDQVGNHFTYQWETTIENIEPEPPEPLDPEILIIIVTVPIGVILLTTSVIIRLDKKRTIFVIIGSVFNILLAESGGLEFHEVFGFVVDVLSLGAIIIATARWFLQKRAAKKWIPKERPEIYV